MSEADRFPTDLQESAEELRSYLADGIPPLLAADAVCTLIGRAPETITGQIQSWLSYQHQARQRTVTYADLAFHALRKLHLIGELGLAPRKELDGYLAALVEALVPLCAPEDRELVRGTLERLRQAPHEVAGSTFHVGAALGKEPAGRAGAGRSEVSPEVADELRRFALLLARLKARPGGGAPGDASPAPTAELASSLLAAAASSARDGSELGKYLEHLADLGVEATDPAAVVRALSRALPAWAPVAPAAPETLGGSARALHRFVDLAEAPQQRLERFREVVAAIAEEFNHGSLARAVALVHVAISLLTEKKVPAADAELVRGRAHDTLDSDRLRTLAVDTQQQPLLRQLMEFFPGLRPEGLITDLEDEPDRGRRRLLLTLLEVHGRAARPALLERMEIALSDTRDIGWYQQRNLCYLLHRIPCAADELEERELEYVVQLSELRHHARVIGEAVIRLGQIDHPRAEAALHARLEEVGAGIAARSLSHHAPDDLERLRGLLATQLLRGASPSGRRAVVEAALQRLRQLGEADQVAGLRGIDLGGEPELVGELLRELHDGLPRKLLGVTLRRNTELIAQIVEGLSSTRTAAVRRTLEELAEKYPREAFGIEASRLLAVFDAPAPAEAPPAAAPATAAAAPVTQRMEGDLELFGLPNLLQSIAQNDLTGTMTLRDGDGATVAMLELREGGLTYCSTGRLQGAPAFYQLLERPMASSFVFLGGEGAGRRAGDGGMEPRGVLGMLMEGMRRHDEYRRARALVPDSTALVPTGTRPTSLPGETDGVFVRELWGQVKGGVTAEACERALAVDAYRVRALLAHWLAEGAVAVSEFDPPAAPA